MPLKATGFEFLILAILKISKLLSENFYKFSQILRIVCKRIWFGNSSSSCLAVRVDTPGANEGSSLETGYRKTKDCGCGGQELQLKQLLGTGVRFWYTISAYGMSISDGIVGVIGCSQISFHCTVRPVSGLHSTGSTDEELFPNQFGLQTILRVGPPLEAGDRGWVLPFLAVVEHRRAIWYWGYSISDGPPPAAKL